ncbi:hypothetical protein T01_14725, partial [Trichinella spiralis]
LVNKRTACQYRIEATGPWFSICRRYAAHPLMSTLSTPVGHCGVLCSRSGRRSNSVDCAVAPEADQLGFRLWTVIINLSLFLCANCQRSTIFNLTCSSCMLSNMESRLSWPHFKLKCNVFQNTVSVFCIPLFFPKYTCSKRKFEQNHNYC